MDELKFWIRALALVLIGVLLAPIANRASSMPQLVYLLGGVILIVLAYQAYLLVRRRRQRREQERKREKEEARKGETGFTVLPNIMPR